MKTPNNAGCTSSIGYCSNVPSSVLWLLSRSADTQTLGLIEGWADRAEQGVPTDVGRRGSFFGELRQQLQQK
jgi:hypothetical protein